MDMRFVSLLDLFKHTADGVNVQVPVGTRSLTMVPSSCAIPLDVYVGGKAGSPKMPGATLYPGGRLVLAQGTNVITVRPLFGLNSGFGWDSSLPLPLPEVDRSATDWGDNNMARVSGATDGSIFSVVDGVIGFLLNADAVDNDAAPNQLPATLRLPALVNEAQTAASSTLGGTALTSAGANVVLVPWAVAPMEVLRRYTRARLRVTVGQCFTAAGTLIQTPVIMRWAPDGLLPMEGLILGTYRATAAYPNRQGEASSTVVIDCGTPTELSGAMGALNSGWRTFCQLVTDSQTAHCSLRAEWIFDHGSARRGQIESDGRIRANTAAASYESLWVYSDGTARVVVNVYSVAGATPELHMVPVDGQASLGLISKADAPGVTIPLPDAVDYSTGLGVYSAALPRGNWMLALYGGGGLVARMEVRS